MQLSKKKARLWPDSATILERSKGIFFSHWEELLRLRRAVIKSSDPDDIHDLRVASRRLRAALELLYPFVPKGEKTELRKRIRTLTQTLGGLRNIDEALIFFCSRTNVTAQADTVLYRKLTELRVDELKRIGELLTGFDYRNLDRIVREIVAALNEHCVIELNSISLLAHFSEVSIRQYQPIHQLLAVTSAPEKRTSRHSLRIAIKKWRYFFEIIAPVLDRDYTPFLELLKEYQSILGRMNDIVEFGALLDTIELPDDERERAAELLKSEDAVLLHLFTELVIRKPLTYTFLI